MDASTCWSIIRLMNDDREATFPSIFSAHFNMNLLNFSSHGLGQMYVGAIGFHVNDSEATFSSVFFAHSNMALLKAFFMFVVLLIVALVMFCKKIMIASLVMVWARHMLMQLGLLLSKQPL